MRLIQRLKLKSLLTRKSLVADRTGATAIEYAIIAGMLSVLIVGGATLMGSKSNTTFNTLSTKVWGA